MAYDKTPSTRLISDNIVLRATPVCMYVFKYAGLRPTQKDVINGHPVLHKGWLKMQGMKMQDMKLQDMKD